MYRKSHVITSSTILTNYQIKLTVYYGSGTDSGDAVYLNSHCNTDFSDIRFKDSNGNELSYWIESYSASTSALVWIKIPSITTNTIIWIYYGQSNVTSMSNGNNTFIFFDDFESGVVSSSKWASGYSSYLVTTTSPYQGTYSAYKTGSQAILRSITLDTLSLHVLEGSFKFAETSKNHYLFNVDKYFLIAGSTVKWAYYTGSAFVVTGVAYSANTWYKVKIILNKSINTYYVYINDSLILTVTNNTLFNSGAPTEISMANSATGLTAGMYFDIIRVRKYATTEPTHGTWGSETNFNSIYRVGGISSPTLLDKCVLYFTGQKSGALFGEFDEFPIIPSGVTVTNNGTFTKTDLGNNKSVLNFDGSTNYISLTDNDAWALYLGPFSVGFWIQFANISNHCRIFSQRVDANNNAAIGWNTTNTITIYGTVAGVITFSYQCPLTPTIGTWYHIVVERSGSDCLIYINGTPQTVTITTAWSSTDTNIAASLTIGQYASSLYMNGNLKDLMIWKGRALTQPEIKLLMNRTHPITGTGLMPANGDYYKLS